MKPAIWTYDKSTRRGAALILEIIIYLALIALIAVSAIMVSGPLRNLAFTTHAKTDTQAAQYWIQGKFAQDNKYPNQTIPSNDEIRLTMSGGFQNTGVVKTSDSGKEWCLLIVSARITDPSRTRFWVSSSDVNEIIQSSTSATTWAPASGVSDLQCPTSAS